MATCTHTGQLAQLRPPTYVQAVHREECTQCFENQDSASGLNVCLHCFNGACADHEEIHVKMSGHTFAVNVKRRRKEGVGRSEDTEPPTKMTKLTIVEEREEDLYEHNTQIKCWKCDPINGHQVPNLVDVSQSKTLVDGVMKAMTSARQSEVKAWEEEILPCEHTLCLTQLETEHIQQSGLAHCTSCDLKENLWLCLTCGSLGCGRQQFGGVDGNGHGLTHFQATGHAVSVKLGTITQEGNADIYCYVCNDAKQDPELSQHLAKFGINVQTLTKTEKSMTELQIEHNLKYDFSLTSDDGKALEPLFGPGLTGLRNLGNSCYMASVLQTIFSLSVFQLRYNTPEARQHPNVCTQILPADCLECQILKIADGLLSGRYSHPAKNALASDESQLLCSSLPAPVFQEGLKPTGFKALIGKGHEEFSTMRQQDSEEFFVHFLTVLRRDRHKHKNQSSEDPTTIFTHGMEQRLQCTECHKVRYRVDTTDVLSVPVPARETGKDAEGRVMYEQVRLEECVDAVLAKEVLEYQCPTCGKPVHALKQSTFASFPGTLVIHAKKFQLVNWVPTKLDIPVMVPDDDTLQFTEVHLGKGLQLHETELLNEPRVINQPQFNDAAMAQLEGMGFPTVRCHKALLATGNSSPEAAMEWLFSHMEDPDIDVPIPSTQNDGCPTLELSAESVEMIADMGFTSAQARKALLETNGNAERAVEWLFNHPDDSGESEEFPESDAIPETSVDIPGTKNTPSTYRLKAFISHKGPSVHSGHYVAHVRLGENWILFNDEKVVKADAESVRELKKLAYLYFFERL